MIDSEYEFTLLDRIAKIQAINEQYDLESNSCIAFSGGRDSCALSHLVDLALPGNKIPRIYVNTGIEYVDMVKFVKEQSKKDERIIIINNNLNIPKTLGEKGYPFKSKEYSRNVFTYYNNQNVINELVESLSKLTLEEINEKYEDSFKNKRGIYVALLILGLQYSRKTKKVEKKTFNNIPKLLQYQFSSDINKLNFIISDNCCLKFKEEPMTKYQRKIHKSIAILGLMKEEKGRRIHTLCTAFNKQGELKTFSPLSIISKEWENEFLERERE